MKNREFGYKVSRDYEKLKNIFMCHKSFISVFGFSDGKRAVIQNIEDNGNVNMYIVHRPTRIEYCSFPYDKIIRYCKKYDLSFIDPEPSNTNAIFYADGSEVENGDNVLVTDIDIQSYYGLKIVSLTITITRFCHYIYIELYHKHIENEYSTICLDDSMFKWDNNRMTNVEKVEK